MAEGSHGAAMRVGIYGGWQVNHEVGWVIFGAKSARTICMFEFEARITRGH